MKFDILSTIAIIGMITGPILFILAWPLSELLVKWESKREGKKKSQTKSTPKTHKASKDDRTFGNPYLKKYYDALDRKDRDGMIAALEECKANCSGANSWCLSEVFCPECPMAGMPVQSGRAGM